MGMSGSFREPREYQGVLGIVKECRGVTGVAGCLICLGQRIQDGGVHSVIERWPMLQKTNQSALFSLMTGMPIEL